MNKHTLEEMFEKLDEMIALPGGVRIGEETRLAAISLKMEYIRWLQRRVDEKGQVG